LLWHMLRNILWDMLWNELRHHAYHACLDSLCDYVWPKCCVRCEWRGQEASLVRIRILSGLRWRMGGNWREHAPQSMRLRGLPHLWWVSVWAASLEDVNEASFSRPSWKRRHYWSHAVFWQPFVCVGATHWEPTVQNSGLEPRVFLCTWGPLHRANCPSPQRKHGVVNTGTNVELYSERRRRDRESDKQHSIALYIMHTSRFRACG
jgi:hypothetical protein